MAVVKRRGELLPVSNAKTAYGLLNDVKAVILEEPKRVYMGDWAIEGKSDVEYFCSTHMQTREGRTVNGPACNTIGCISGWVTFLKPEKRVHASCGENIVAPRAEGYGSDDAGRDLVNGSYSDDPIFPLRTAVYDLFMNTNVKAPYGTKKYAQIVARRIESFQKKWAKELKKVKV